MLTLPEELILTILSFNKPFLSYFLVSKLFNELSNIAYKDIKRYITEMVLVRFYYFTIGGCEICEYNISGQMYLFMTWSEYRRHKSYKLETSIGLYKYSGIYRGLLMERIKEEEVIEFAKKNIDYLSSDDIIIKFREEIEFEPEEDDCVNDLEYKKYLTRLYSCKYHKKEIKNEFKDMNYLEYLYFDDKDFVRFLLSKDYKITEDALRIAEENNCEENLEEFANASELNFDANSVNFFLKR